MTTVAVSFGTLLRDLRLRAGLTQGELARRLGGFDHSTVSKWESGHLAPPNPIRVEALCKILEDTDEWRLLIAAGYLPPGVPLYKKEHRAGCPGEHDPEIAETCACPIIHGRSNAA